MSLFASVSRLFRPAPSSQTEKGLALPYGLTDGEWRKLKTLASGEEWKIFERVLDEAVKFDGERILQTSNTEALHFLRGHVEGLRKASRIIREIELKEHEFERERERRAEAGERRRPHAGLFGSPGWRPDAT